MISHTSIMLLQLGTAFKVAQPSSCDIDTSTFLDMVCKLGAVVCLFAI